MLISIDNWNPVTTHKVRRMRTLFTGIHLIDQIADFELEILLDGVTFRKERVTGPHLKCLIDDGTVRCPIRLLLE